MMEQFTPAVYLIANVSTEKPTELLEKLTEKFTEAYGPADSFYAVDQNVIAFVNQHPESGEVLFEIQALTVEDSANGVKAATEIAKEVAGIELSWVDVTRAAVEYHSSKPKEEEGQE